MTSPSVDTDGYITYIARTDDVFKASDYKISPFELENVLIEHPAVVDAAVVPAPDPVRLAVPKAYVVLAPGYPPTRETALSILQYAREHLAPFQLIRRLEFAELPKTISGKIRRVELRQRENTHPEHRTTGEWRDDQFPELNQPTKEIRRAAPAAGQPAVSVASLATGRYRGARSGSATTTTTGQRAWDTTRRLTEPSIPPPKPPCP